MKRALALTLLSFAIVAPAFAAPGDNPRRRVDFYDNSGTLHEMDNLQDQSMIAMMLKHAHKLAPGSIVITQDGQFFVLRDFKTPSGQMLTDELMQQ